MKLSTLKEAIKDKINAADVDVKSYVLELEAAVTANKRWLIGVAAACLIIGGAIGHFVL